LGKVDTSLKGQAETKKVQQDVTAGARPKDLNDAVGRLTQAQEAYKATPNAQTKLVADNAKADVDVFQHENASKTRLEEAAKVGDPTALAEGLFRGDVAWSQVVSSRKPEDAKAAYDATDKLSMARTGKHFSAVTNEANYKQATDPAVRKTLNLIDALTEPKGSIDLTREAFLRIPGKMDEKTFNGIMAGVTTEFGGQSTTDFRAAVTGMAGEYSQIISGGAGTNESFQHALQIIQQAYSRGQGLGALDVLTAEVAARKKGIVRDNPALMAAYPDASQTPARSAAQKHGFN
jgi:hypothetical protein